MSQDKKSTLIKYLVCFCIAAAMVFVVFLIQGLFNGEAKDVKEIMYILQNAFCIPGLLMMLFSGLMFVSDQGGFLGIGYALRKAVRIFFPVFNKESETYAEYRERKTGKKSGGGKLAVFLTGLSFFFISIIFLIIWYNV